MLAVRLGQGRLGDAELVVAVQQELVELLPVGFVVQGVLEVLEEVELALSADLEAHGDLGKSAEALVISGSRVDRVQSNCIGILEACPPLP